MNWIKDSAWLKKPELPNLNTGGYYGIRVLDGKRISMDVDIPSYFCCIHGLDGER